MNQALADIGSFWKLYSRFARPYIKLTLGVVILQFTTGILKASQKLCLAPLLYFMTEGKSGPAVHWTRINLGNISPTLMQAFEIDRTNLHDVMWFCVQSYLVVSLTTAACALLAQWLLLLARTAISRDMTVAVHWRMLGMPYKFLRAKGTGDHVSRISNDILRCAHSIDAVTRGVMQSFAELCVYAVLLFRTDVTFSCIVVALGSVHFLTTNQLGRRARRRIAELQEQMGSTGHRLYESLKNIRITKLFAVEKFDSTRIRETSERLREFTIRYRLAMFLENPIRAVSEAIITCVAIRYAVHLMFLGEWDFNNLAMFLGLTWLSIHPITESAKKFVEIRSLAGAAKRPLEILDMHNTLKDGDLDPDPFNDRIVFENIQFSYETGRPVLSDLNLTIPKGKTVAVVGPSGSGKTSLVDLLLRLNDPEHGRILYDGIDVTRFRQRPYRKRFGVVQQESSLLNLSLTDNVVLGRELNRERVSEVLWMANCDELVTQLPSGRETLLGDGGHRLSGGEAQRVAIARAIYGNPSILVLDEATSALDSEAEHDVHEAIQRVAQSMTVIIVAHRFSTILHADEIIVLKEGRIESQGNSRDLLQSSPVFRRLYDLQISEFTAHQTS
jgi:ABC-type multidrug transport system fused ATPase/permease subunit